MKNKKEITDQILTLLVLLVQLYSFYNVQILNLKLEKKNVLKSD